MNKKVIVISGPTGVGKTKMSIGLAKLLDGEIINCDSMQMYKGLNIGTAKITEEKKEGIPHYLFDVIEVNEEFSIYNYQEEARKIIDDIFSRGKTPIMVGGSGLYMKSVIYDYKFNKEDIKNDFERYSTEELYAMLVDLVPNVLIDKDNRRRVVRALNYYIETGRAISENRTTDKVYDAIIIGLTMDRDKLYKGINIRVDKMIKDGLIDEVKSYYDRRVYSRPLLSGIGYKELYRYFDGKASLEEAIEQIKINTRHYAKRQYTFLRNQLEAKWFNVDLDNFNESINEVYSYIKDNM